MCNIYFTSDLHFSHQNIAKFCPQFRIQATVDEMDEALIAYWNATVQPEDIVYNLGDISFARDVPAIAKIMRRLNGQHHLIFGNHDNVIMRNSEYFLTRYRNGTAAIKAGITSMVICITAWRKFRDVCLMSAMICMAAFSRRRILRNFWRNCPKWHIMAKRRLP